MFTLLNNTYMSILRFGFMVPFVVLTSNRLGLVVLIRNSASFRYGLNTVRRAFLLLGEKANSVGLTNTGKSILDVSAFSTPYCLLEVLMIYLVAYETKQPHRALYFVQDVLPSIESLIFILFYESDYLQSYFIKWNLAKT